jgi:hypothetical protein
VKTECGKEKEEERISEMARKQAGYQKKREFSTSSVVEADGHVRRHKAAY